MVGESYLGPLHPVYLVQSVFVLTMLTRSEQPQYLSTRQMIQILLIELRNERRNEETVEEVLKV